MELLDKREYQRAWQTAGEAAGLPAAAVEEAAPDHGKLAQALLASVRGALAERPAFHPREECSFLRQDDYWTIWYHGQSAFLKSTRGLQCLCCLLRAPGREFHVSELLANLLDAPGAVPAAAAEHGRPRPTGEQYVTAGLHDFGPILDGQAKTEYKRRLTEIRGELEEARRFNDPGRAARVQDEMNAIARHLANAIGLGGRDRKSSSEAERARCAVTKRIKKAVQKISDAIPSLGHHLRARVKTGYFCSYNPHPERPVAWKF
jgi:non-specific serine/threonine protein kinase